MCYKKKKIEKLIKNLNDVDEVYKDHLIEMIEAEEGKIYPLDFFYISVLQRSYYLVSGFVEMIKNNNFFAAAPLVRMNFDNVLHSYAMYIVKNPHELTTNIMRGKKRLKDYKDKCGCKNEDEV